MTRTHCRNRTPCVCCPPYDNVQQFQQNGSSYEWNNWYGGRPVDRLRRRQNPISEAFRMCDCETSTNWGRTGKHVLYADFHVDTIQGRAPTVD